VPRAGLLALVVASPRTSSGAQRRCQTPEPHRRCAVIGSVPNSTRRSHAADPRASACVLTRVLALTRLTGR
jgi:hypothetical protein